MERKFVIVTDSSCDLSEEYLAKHQVHCVPLGFTVDGVVYGGDDGEYMDVKTFYETLRKGAMPKTYQVSPEQAKTHLTQFVQAGQDVLVIAFSSGLSGTANSFAVAARELMEENPGRKVLVVDSLCASLGEGLLVDYVVKKADTYAEIEEVYAYAEQLKCKICHQFTVDSLFHLKRGGRVSSTTAIVGSILKIKPVMHVNDEGRLVPVGKAMGRRKSISALVEHMERLADLGENDPIFISHGDCMEDVDFLIGLIHAKFGKRDIYVNYVGNVIGTHSGAGTLALFFKGKQR